MTNVSVQARALHDATVRKAAISSAAFDGLALPVQSCDSRVLHLMKDSPRLQRKLFDRALKVSHDPASAEGDVRVFLLLSDEARIGAARVAGLLYNMPAFGVMLGRAGISRLESLFGAAVLKHVLNLAEQWPQLTEEIDINRSDLVELIEQDGIDLLSLWWQHHGLWYPWRNPLAARTKPETRLFARDPAIAIAQSAIRHAKLLQ